MSLSFNEILKSIILDGQSEIAPVGTRRHLHWEIVPGKALVCVGVRRGGKSTLMAQIMAGLLAKGVSKQSLLYIDFFDDRLREICRDGLSPVLDAYFSLFPAKKGKETIHCFFDEIQEVKDWESFISRLMRTENCQVYLTGSSATTLSREIATQMRGRSLAWELFPFSFREFLDHRQVAMDALTTANVHLARHHFEDYWRRGGFPEVLDLSDKLRIMTHQEYFKTILHRDVVQRQDALHPQAVAQLAYRLIGSSGSLYTLNRLTGYLKSQGYKLSKAFVSDCLQWFEDAYFLFSVRLFASTVSRQNANPRKIYCVDHAMAASVSTSISSDAGHLLETLVFGHLRRHTERIWYHRTLSGQEIDFIWQSEAGQRHAVQVCTSLSDEAVRGRELSALRNALPGLGLTSGTIVTLAEESLEEDGELRIAVVPAWRFLLEVPGQAG